MVTSQYFYCLHGTYFPGSVNDAVFGCERIGRSHRHRIHESDHYRRGLCDRGGDAELPECDPGSRRRQYLYGSGTDGAVRQDRVRVSIVRNPGRHGNLDRHSSVLELWLCDSGDPVLFRQMEAQEAGLMTGVAGTQRGYSGRIHPANSRMDWFSAFFSLCCICLRYSLGDICISLIK